jgi:hypothetical protein
MAGLGEEEPALEQRADVLHDEGSPQHLPEWATLKKSPDGTLLRRRLKLTCHYSGGLMHISNSSIFLAASHDSIRRREQHESLTLWQRDSDGSRRELRLQNDSPQPSSTLSVSLAAMAAHREDATMTPASATKPEAAEDEQNMSGDPELTLIRLLLQRFTGREVTTVDARFLRDQGEVRLKTEPGAIRENNSGWGALYQREDTTYEAESTRFSATGVVTTADGRTISLNLTLEMSREYLSRTSITVRAGEALKDPLVINFNGSAAQLTGALMQFDLDADGNKESVRFVGDGSGLLALDRNGDNVINDGSELFGTRSGNGFADLGTYDQDGNGWIDEADDIFNHLLVWTRPNESVNQLTTLADSGVGALYLGRTDTPFSLKDDTNSLLGVIRSSGLYLNEDGSSGTLQQVDVKTD